MALSFSEAKKISITDYLSSSGFEPAKIRGADYWYHSPFRHERNPSFKVNTKINVWYDHGSGEGGTIIDLGAKLHGCSLHDFLLKLAKENYSLQEFPLHRNSLDVPERKLDIVSVRDLSNQDLVHYLQDRKIKTHFAHQYCKEVEFRIASKFYCAIGFPNRSGGYELRNRWFKGSSSPKDVSIVDNGSSGLCVMEGFMDFLSVLTLNQMKDLELPLNSSFLILNSLSFLNRNLSVIQSHSEVVLFLDNDLAGKEARTGLTSKGITFRDAGKLYAPYKDVNEFITKRKGSEPTLPRSKGLRP